MTDASKLAVAESVPTPEAAKPSELRVPFLEQVKSFERPFWAGNAMEMIERLAYYGVRVVIPIYIASTEDPAGLHFTNVQKGTILTIWALVQALLPMFTGGFADRYGGKSTIAISIVLKIAGYLLMATQRSFGGFLFGCCTLAAGTAVFKPGVWGTLARGMNRTNSSVGWGIFYQLVNVGGFLGPPLAGFLHHYAWKWVFFACASIVSLNFLTLLTYDDKAPPDVARDAGPTDEKAPNDLTNGTPLEVFFYSVKRVFRGRLITFLLINGGFYIMFMQLYDMLPNFIEEWINSSDIVATLGLHEGQLARVAENPVLSRGLQVPQEWMINLDSAAIVLFVVLVAYVNRRLRRLVAIALGILLAAGGLLLCGITMRGWICVLGIGVFAIGEMTAAPKLYEYLGVIAPKGEESLYMGYANIPFAIGWALADTLGGIAYDRVADKANLALRYMSDHALVAPEALAKIARPDAMKQLIAVTHLDAQGATDLLWAAYHPQTVWYPFVGIGVVSAIAMVLYARAAEKWTHENA